MPNKRKCRNCGKFDKPEEMLIVPLGAFCDYACASEYGLKNKQKGYEKKAKEDRRKHKESKERTKTRQEWVRDAQRWFNKFIRLRDKGIPCISCGKPDNGQHQRHASHYRSCGSCSSLRFDESNVHASCSVCNNHLSGNIEGYRPALIEKIGKEEHERILSSPKAYKWTIEELKEIKSTYKQKCKELEK